MPRFIPRAVEVEAMQWIGDNFAELHAWVGAQLCYQRLDGQNLVLDTAHQPTVLRGHWIVANPYAGPAPDRQTRWQVYSAAEFAATFAPAPTEPAEPDLTGFPLGQVLQELHRCWICEGPPSASHAPRIKCPGGKP